MAAGNTYAQLATVTLSSAVAQVTLSSIPSTYTDLILVSNDLLAQYTTIRVNGDSSNNYNNTYLYGNGTSVTSVNDAGDSVIWGSWGSIGVSTGIARTMQFMNYSNSTTYKTMLSRFSNAATSGSTEAFVSMWRSTAAINSITIGQGASTTFAAGSTFSLYGIAAA